MGRLLQDKPGAGPRGREGGAALVEFALILPIFMMLVLALFTGGHAYNAKLGLTSGAREGARNGATLPFSGLPAPADQTWLNRVADTAVDSAGGDFAVSASGRWLCVAYVSPGTTAPDRTLRLEQRGSGSRTFTASGPCVYRNGTPFNDGRPASERRVQVIMQRDAKLEAMVWTQTVTLTARGVSRWEAA